VTSAEAHHRIPATVGKHIHAVVNAMNQEIEINALRRRCLIRGNRSHGTRSGIRV
jgi:hypothetical protein